MTWRDKYKVHPAADVFPMMSDEELEALGQDILENGLREPIKIMRVRKAKQIAENAFSQPKNAPRWPQSPGGDGARRHRPRQLCGEISVREQ